MLSFLVETPKVSWHVHIAWMTPIKGNLNTVLNKYLGHPYFFNDAIIFFLRDMRSFDGTVLSCG